MPRSRSTASRATRPRARAASPRAIRTAIRVAEATGSSPDGWDAAVADAVASAKTAAPAPVGVEVVKLWGELDARRRIRTYRASVKIAYPVALVRP